MSQIFRISSTGDFSTRVTALHCKSISSITLIILNCIERINQLKEQKYHKYIFDTISLSYFKRGV